MKKYEEVATMAHVLIVEADPSQAEIVRIDGHDCVHARPNDAIDAVMRERPDVVVLACANPTPFARAIQSLSPHIGMVAVCGELALEDQRTLKRNGVGAIVFRPFGPQTLAKAIAAQLPHSWTVEETRAQ